MSTWLHDSRLVCYNSVISVSSTCAAPAASWCCSWSCWWWISTHVSIN